MLDAVKRACFIVFINIELYRSPFTLTFKLLNLHLGRYFFPFKFSQKMRTNPLFFNYCLTIPGLNSQRANERAGFYTHVALIYTVTLVPQLVINRNTHLYFLNKLSNFLQIKLAIKIIIQLQNGRGSQ